jgi:hypothetical protein
VDDSSPLPDIPECVVEQVGDGFKVTHKRTGDTEHAADLEGVEAKGVILRVSASYQELPFRTGDPS